MFFNSYINYTWRLSSKIFEYEIQKYHWTDIYTDEDIHQKIQIMCKGIFPFKTKSVLKLDLILEHSILNSIQSQIVFFLDEYNIDLIISSAVYESFGIIMQAPIFKKMMDEQAVIWYAAKKIQFCWRRCISNPSYFVCRRRLLREFNDM